MYNEFLQLHSLGQDNYMYELLVDAYLYDKPTFNQFISEFAHVEGISTDDVKQFLLEVLGLNTGGPNIRSHINGDYVPGDYNLHEYTDEFLDDLM